MPILVSLDIHVILVLRLSMGGEFLWDVNVHMVVCANIAVIFAVRHSLKREPL
jgi:hypothetical protein